LFYRSGRSFSTLLFRVVLEHDSFRAGTQTE
jgi:hypothetical protein